MKKYYTPNLGFLVLLFIGAFFFSTPQNSSLQAQSNLDKLKFFGDFRFRFENDFENEKFNGKTKDARQRLRYRARFGFKYFWSDKVELGMRVRSGSPTDQQSPHYTFGQGEFQKTALGFDKAYVKGKYSNGLWWWMGKNSYPFCKATELFWDDDVNPEGFALGGKFKLNETMTLSPVAGYFIPRHSGKTLSKDGTMTGIGAKLSSKGSISFNIGTNLLAFKGMANPGLKKYVDDYTFSHSSLGIKFKAGSVPMQIGGEFMMNLADYSKDTLVLQNARGLEDEKTGFVAFLKIGKTKVKGDWQLRYYFTSIGKFAVVDYFAQDDYMRWGGGPYGTTASNFSGHEFRFTYMFGKKFNAVARYYLVSGLKENKATSGNNYKAGSRFRLDFNMKF